MYISRLILDILSDNLNYPFMSLLSDSKEIFLVTLLKYNYILKDKQTKRQNREMGNLIKHK